MSVSHTVSERYSATSNGVTLKSGLGGRSRSMKVAPFDRPCATYYWSAVVSTVLSCTIFELSDVEYYRDLEIWVKGHSRSLKTAPFESLCKVSYSHYIVTMVVSCIISEI